MIIAVFIAVLGSLLAALQAAGFFILKGIKSDVKDIKDHTQKRIDELSEEIKDHYKDHAKGVFGFPRPDYYLKEKTPQ